MVRRKIQKGTDFDNKTDEEIAEIEDEINNSPPQDNMAIILRGIIRGRGKKAGVILNTDKMRGWQQWQPYCDDFQRKGLYIRATAEYNKII